MSIFPTAPMVSLTNRWELHARLWRDLIKRLDADKKDLLQSLDHAVAHSKQHWWRVIGRAA